MLEPVRLAVIGGSGLYKLDGLEVVKTLEIDTPYGRPSSPITIARTELGTLVAFLARHGPGHIYKPTNVPNRANIAALKHLGVRAIIAFSAVGSLQEQYRPRDFVIPTQIIDRTRGFRESTFYEDSFVGHIPFGDPFDTELGEFIASVENALPTPHKLHSVGVTQSEDITVVCMEGPAFSTRAESNMYRSWGGSVINMSAIPESKLAREACIAYQMIGMITDYDCWKMDEESVSVELVLGHMNANTVHANSFLMRVLEKIEKEGKTDTLGIKYKGSFWASVQTIPQARDAQVQKNLEWVFAQE